MSFLTLGSWAQDNKDKIGKEERFRKDMEQFITQKAGLSPKQVAHFFPVYHEMKDKQKAIHDKIKKLKKSKPATEADYKKIIQDCDDLEIEMKNIQKKYHEKFLRVLPAKKLFDVIKAEDSFHKQAFKQAAEQMNKKK